jgi:hypothetical protein
MTSSVHDCGHFLIVLPARGCCTMRGRTRVTMKLRFSIRDLLWLTALCAVVVAWWIDRSNLSARLEALEKSKSVIMGGKPWDYIRKGTP